jgi:hypothetical protein
VRARAVERARPSGSNPTADTDQHERREHDRRGLGITESRHDEYGER